MKNDEAKNVDEYIASAPKGLPARTVGKYLASLPSGQRKALKKLRAQIKAAAPKATERISYGIPIFFQNGMLVAYAGFKNYCSFVVMATKAMKTYKKELEPYEKTRGTIHFTPEKPIPAALVKKIVKLRVKEKGKGE